MPSISIPAAIGIGAGVSAVGAVGGSLIAKSASDNATKAAANAAAANDALAQQQFGVVEGNAQPYVDRGNAAGDEVNGLLGVGGNAAASQTALNNFTNSDGYQFAKKEGVSAITGNAATNGLLDSGSTLKALDEYGQGLADQQEQTYIGDLGSVANTGVAANNTLAGASAANVNSQSSSNNNAASAAGTGAYTTASTTNALLQNALGSISSIYGSKNASSFGSANNDGFSSNLLGGSGAFNAGAAGDF